MKKQLFLLLALIASQFSYAEEGMWIPSLLKKLNANELKAAGLKIPVEKIWSTQESSIKDAIVHFGGGCTAEVLSYEGLILTNHHCGYSQIQAHSSLENDYLKNGFWAMNRTEELPNPGLTVSFVVDMVDVTDQVMRGCIDENGRVNNEIIKANIERVRQANAKDGYEIAVRPFNYGNSFFMIITETYRDVRLVGAPPSSIGKFGGDTDNWVWPRHTGDFTLFRIYAGKDNRPADYSPDNVPYRPKYSLPVSMMGVRENDFTMVFGFPGTTQQFLPAAAVEFLVKHRNPARIKMRETALNIIDTDMRSSDLIRIQYSAKQARISNYYKKWIGENNGLIRLNAIDKKKELEREFIDRAKRDRNDLGRFGQLPDRFVDLYIAWQPFGTAYDYFSELVYSGPEFLRYAQGFEKLVESYSVKSVGNEGKSLLNKISAAVPGYFKNYNAATDKKLFVALFPMYLDGTPEALRPDGIPAMKKKYKDDWNLLANEIFSKSVFTDKGRLEKFLKGFSSSSAKKLSVDPGWVVMKMVYDTYRKKVEATYRSGAIQQEVMMADYVAGLMKFFPDKKYWYDANSTLRLTYGKVEGSKPRDGIIYDYYTTVEGMMEKYKAGDEEFDVAPKMIELWKNKDYGPYGFKNEMPLAFTASNHTTGGNSGSPVLDANGYLIGINFDRSWESTMSDVMFDPERCRNIAMDIRYLLFVIDKFAGAGHLLREMELMTPEKMIEKKKMEDHQAILAITEKIRSNPDKTELLFERVHLYFSLRMFREAETDLRALIALSPKSVEAFHLLGMALIEQKKYTDAIKELDRAIAMDKQMWEAVLDKGIALSELKRYDEAVRVFTTFISANSFDHRGYYNRGITYHLMNRSVEGCADLMVAEKLGGNRENFIRKQLCE
ncbi:MAG: S46 family peptidase [Flavobacteriales bacterium]